MLRIWFNRAYESTAQVIEMLRANPDNRPVQVIGTHTDPDSPVLRACDEAYPEAELTPDDYVDWALAFSAEHRVDVLVPRARLAELSAAKGRFAEVGTRLLCADPEVIGLFADKAATYAAASELDLPVPPHHVVTDATALRAAYAELIGLAERVCVKPTRGTNGAGFRILTDRPPRLSDFAGQARARADLGALCTALDAADDFAGSEAAADLGRPRPELLVMPYLPGPEISMDVLADRDGNPAAIVGRTRSRRRRTLVDDRPARRVAEELTRAHRIGYLSNIQVRYWQAPADRQPRPYLLDVNTRLSGGLFQTALAGVNLPWAAVRLLLGESPEPLRPWYGAAFTTASTLVPLPPAADGTQPGGRPLD